MIEHHTSSGLNNTSRPHHSRPGLGQPGQPHPMRDDLPPGLSQDAIDLVSRAPGRPLGERVMPSPDKRETIIAKLALAREGGIPAPIEFAGGDCTLRLPCPCPALCTSMIADWKAAVGTDLKPRVEKRRKAKN